MTVLFHAVNLPEEIEQGAQGGPAFLTSVLPFASGTEDRNIDWDQMREKWDISYGISSREDYDVVRHFFIARRAKAYGWLFKNWSDYVCNFELAGLGNGSQTAFQIVKTYEPAGPLPYTRKITRPRSATLIATVDGTPTTLFTLGALGLVTFNSPPPNTKEVRFYCEFDFPMRFDTDNFDLTLDAAEAGTIGRLPICELRE